MKNEPKVIYLNIGQDIDKSECDELYFEETREVTWSKDEISFNDIKFIHYGELVDFLKVNHRASVKDILKHLEYLR